MRKIRPLHLLLIILPSLHVGSYSQTDSLGWSYFPFKTGDMWEYRVYDGITIDTAQSFNTKDSVSADGRIHLTRHFRFINPSTENSSTEYIIDTATGEVFAPFAEPTDPPRTTYVRLYKFDARQGDQWVMYDYSTVGGAGYDMVQIKEMYDGTLFGRSTSFMRILYYAAADSADTSGLDYYVETLAKGFGVVELLPSEPGGWSYSLKGAVVNDIVYGDTTQVVTSVDNPKGGSRRTFTLHQNYPNPFNPSTTIRFTLDRSSDVSLVIYDVAGREIRTLVNNARYASGEYKILWDGKTNSGQSASTGVYLYQLTSGGIRLVRS